MRTSGRAIDTNPKPLYNYFRWDTDNFIIVSEWWNGQTRTFEGRMPRGVRVQVPPPTPYENTKPLRNAKVFLLFLYVSEIGRHVPSRGVYE